MRVGRIVAADDDLLVDLAEEGCRAQVGFDLAGRSRRDNTIRRGDGAAAGGMRVDFQRSLSLVVERKAEMSGVTLPDISGVHLGLLDGENRVGNVDGNP